MAQLLSVNVSRAKEARFTQEGSVRIGPLKTWASPGRRWGAVIGRRTVRGGANGT